MSKSYADKLIDTKTYKELLTIRQTRWFKPFPSPKANQQQHIVVMKARGGEYSLHATLTESNPSLRLRERILSDLLYIIVDVEPQTMQLSTRYDFEDLQKHRLDVTTTLEYQVADAKILVEDGRDAIKELKESAEDTIQSYLDTVGPGKVDLASLEESLGEQLQQATLEAKQELGVEVTQVSIETELGKERAESYQQKLDRIQNVTRLLGAIQLSGVSLKTLIERLDLRLMLNFFTLEWKDAMGKLQARLNDIIDGKDYERRIKLLNAIETDEMCIEKVRKSIVDIMSENLLSIPEMHAISIPMSQVPSLSQPHSPLPETVSDDQISTSVSDGDVEGETVSGDTNTLGTVELKKEDFGTYQKIWRNIFYVNELLEGIEISDMSLRAIIEKLDFRLVLNFYYLEWDEAIDKLRTRLDDIVEGRDYKKGIGLLKAIGTDELYIEKVRASIADTVDANLSNASGLRSILALVSRIQPPSQHFG